MNLNYSVKREPMPWLQWMPNWLEFGLIFGLTLWPFVYSSVVALLTSLSGGPPQSHLTSLLILEMYALALVVPLMYARGWTIASLGFQFQWRDAVTAMKLVILAYAGYVALWLIFLWMLPQGAAPAEPIVSQYDIATLFAASLVNGFFEELFVAAYLIHCVRSKYGVVAAVNASIFVRVIYHLHQGPISVIGVIPIGVVFAWTYARTGRLWPLVVAHAALDLIALHLIAD